MSDITPYDTLHFTDRQIIESIVNDKFFSDYGFVKAVHDNKTVDVEHAARDVTIKDEVYPATLTMGVELLFPSTSAFSVNYTVKTGDRVLLIGLRNVLPTVASATSSKAPSDFFHYSQETLKAIPMAEFGSTSDSSIIEKDGSITIKALQKITLTASTGSLFSFVADLAQETSDGLTQVSGALTALAGAVGPYAGAASAAIASYLAQIAVIQGNIAATKAKITGGSN